MLLTPCCLVRRSLNLTYSTITLSALQAKDNINKGVEEWNPKDDPHAQVPIWPF